MPQCVLNNEPWLLPRTLDPTLYKLTLKPSLKNFVNEGEMNIEFKVLQKTSCVVLHKEDLEISDIILFDSHTREGKRPSSVEYLKESQQLVINFNDEFKINETYSLIMKFKGIIRKDLRGFYRSSYNDNQTGQLKWLAVTQFEALSARTAFPCFDEPYFKSVVKVTIVLSKEEKDLEALSNMKVRSITFDNNGSKIITYDESPKMSSYLIAYAIGEFEYIQETALNIRFRIYTVKGLSHEGRFALDTAIKTTKWFHDFFQIEYSLDKMDLIAIPDFSGGAMENWGLVTFRNALLLYNERTTQPQKERIASIIVHEISHFWCGNYVTMKWWNELFLKEGWATFFAVHTTDLIFNGWDLWEKSLLSNQRFLRDDSLPSSPGLIQDVRYPSEVDAMFNTISYQKGGAYYKMLYEYIGDEVFTKWMRQFIKKYLFKSVVTHDLVYELASHLPSTKPINEYIKNFRTWTDKPGYPVVRVLSVSDKIIKLKQQRFYSQFPSEPDRRTWWIPLNYKDSNGNSLKFEFNTEESLPITIPLNSPGWFTLNKNHFGCFRVNYTVPQWNSLINAVARNDRGLSSMDKLGLADDSFSFAGTGDQKIDITMRLAESLQRDTSFALWSSQFANFRVLSDRVAGTEVTEKLNNFIRKLLLFNLERLGWDVRPNEPDDDTLNRPLFLQTASHFSKQLVLDEAIRRFRSPNPIPEFLKQIVYNSVLIADENNFSLIEKRYKESRDVEEKMKLLHTMSLTRNTNNMVKVLEIILSSDVRAQDGNTFIDYMVKNNLHATEFTWEFFKKNYDRFLSKFGQANMDTRIMNSVTQQFHSRLRHDEVYEFFKNRTNSPYFKIVLANILQRKIFREKIYEDLKNFLK